MTFRFQPSEEGDDDLGPPPGPFQFRRRPRFRMPGGLMRWGVVLAVLIILFIVLNVIKGIYADWLWFDSIDYLSVYRVRIVTRIWLFFAGAGVFLAFFGANVILALRAPSGASGAGGGISSLSLPDFEPAAIGRITVIATVAASLFLAVIFGTQAASQWDNILLFINSESFGVTEPAFDKDLGFYVFRLPALNFILGWSMGAAVLTTVVAGGIYAFRMLLGGFSMNAPAVARPHISLLLIVVLGLFVWRYWLSRYGLVYSDRGAAFGASFTDMNAQLPVIYVLMALATLTALAILLSVFRRGLLFLPLGAAAIWVVAAIVGGLIYPATVQRFTVEPNELAKEREFIQRNIDATRAAYGLDQIDVRPFLAREFVTEAEIEANPETIRNIRLWDSRPLLQTLDQLQEIRPLYDFVDVDVDRYMIDGQLRQVMLSARELNQANLEADSRSWVNRRLKLTHGFGIALLPVNEVVGEGLPTFFVSGIPTDGVLEFDGADTEPVIEQPRVYFGELPDEYVIIDSNEEEFDYPTGETDATTVYDAGGGVKLNSFLRRIVYAWEFADTDILISDALSDDSRLLYRRNVRERVESIAPFLRLDADPYLVIADGQLFWMLDAYTHTDRYPYSTRFGDLNYIRNSVKVVVNAYDGSTTFYVLDQDDPIVKAYAGIYTDLFTPFEEMPAALQDHIRYPEDLFNVQTQLYRRYHLEDADVFFLGEAYWDIPTEKFIDQEQPLEPYYVIMNLPGEVEEEFVLMLPFRLRGERRNTIAWLAARSDGDQYGHLVSFRFPTDSLVLGPSQVESRIDQDTTISQQLSLWNQAGSQVIRGNLLMIPIGEGNLFVEPIYLQATSGRLPELKRVVVANGNQIAMEETLDRALEVVLGRAPPSTPTIDDGIIPTPQATPAEGETPLPTSTPQPTPAVSGDVDELIQQANASFLRAQQLLQQGDFAGYGEEIEQLEEILQRLAELSDLAE
ncbi:MAG: UPF0182 family protein [Dehalococcoidia bacterium]